MTLYIIFGITILAAVLFIAISYSSLDSSKYDMEKRIQNRVNELNSEHRKQNNYDNLIIDKEVKNRHQQIINESYKIIDSTKNLDTLLGRHKEIIDNYYAIKQKRDVQFETELSIRLNKNIVRIYNYKKKEYLDKIIKIKSIPILESATAKILEEGSEMSIYLHGNKERHLSIAEIKKIKEEIILADRFAKINLNSNTP